jgi:hypothetical protein
LPGHYFLQTTVFLLQTPDTAEFAHIHAGLLIPPAVKRDRTDAVLAAYLFYVEPILFLFKDVEDLLFGKIALFSYALR